MAEPRLLSTQQIAEHNNAKDLWIVVDGQVWDLTELVGTLDTSTISDSWAKPPPQQNPQLQLKNEKPPLFTLLSTHDFESVAEKTLAPKTWAFYSSAATDLVTHRANQSFFDRIWFRPRVLRNIRTRDTSAKILGQD
ncbi:MAG: hypothetical protein LQ349_004811, partial [Xanthoria aureola]